MRAILHLFCEDVGGIHFARDMTNLKSLVLVPFANQILAKLDVPSGLRGQIVQPLYTGIVVIVENSGRVDAWEKVAGVQHAARKVAEINNFLGGGVASHELREVCSWHSPSQPIGLPFLKTMPSFILQNLKSESNVPSATELPS